MDDKIVLPRDIDDDFKAFSDFWDEDQNLRDYLIPTPIDIDPADFDNAFSMTVQCTPWSRRKAQWDFKVHLKKCRGITVMRRALETVQLWVKKHEPNKIFPERTCTVDVSPSPLYNDQLDVIMTGIAGEHIEMVLDTFLKDMKQTFR